MKEKNNATKDKIITVSKQLFNQMGFDNVTINEICSGAEISKHTFYYYFESKEDILKKFYTMKTEFSSKLMIEVMNQELNIEKLWVLMQPPIKHFTVIGPEVVKRMFVSNLTKDSVTLRKHFKENEFSDMEIKFLRDAQEAGEINNMSEPVILTKLVYLQSLSLIQLWSITDGLFDIDRALRVTFENLLDVKKAYRKENPQEQILGGL